ncbi:MAG TPA: hemerythrin [Firmicutes bacterium]|nr:hemerythrin [Bacillota bacterium]
MVEGTGATDELRHEHDIILHVVFALNRACQRAEETGQVNLDFFTQAVDFLRVFADQCHHGKEENILFPLLEQRGIPRQGGPIGVMLAEHQQGRTYVRGMADALSADQTTAGADHVDRAAVISELLKQARAYVDLIRAHIQKENTVLFPMAEKVLSEDDKRSVREQFERFEEEVTGKGQHERYHQLAHELVAASDLTT